MKFKRLLSLLTAAVVLPNLYIPVSVSDTVYAESREKTLVVGDGKYNYREEPQDGYLYEVWINDEGGSGKVTIGEGGTFNAEWDVEVPQGNFIVQRGLPYDYLKRTLNYRSIEIDYDADYSAGERGNSQLSIYGWFKDPLVEYYIVEDWVNWRPTGDRKTVIIDGSEYDIFRTYKTGPTILGDTRVYKRYYSVRRDKRSSGTVNVSKHFEAWRMAGWEIGDITDISLLVEGWECSGKADVKKLVINNIMPVTTTSAGTDVIVPTTTTEAQPIIQPDGDGYYFRSDFENDTGAWFARGLADLKTDDSCSESGKNSIFVSDRAENWCGVEYPLDEAVFLPEHTYSFGCAVLQDSVPSEKMKLMLNYTDEHGFPEQKEIASVTAEKGEWTILSNPTFTFPLKYRYPSISIESDGTPTDYYVDNFGAAVKGTKFELTDHGQNESVTTTIQETTTTETASSTTTSSAEITTSDAATSTTQDITATSETATSVTSTETTSSMTAEETILYGDANLDGIVSLSDSVLIMQSLANPDTYGINGSDKKHITAQGRKNADCFTVGDGVTGNDALAIQKFALNLISKLPE